MKLILNSVGTEVHSWWRSFKSPAIWLNILIFRVRTVVFLNLLKTTGHVMHQQFNIQQL